MADLFVQHYDLVTDLIESFALKDTRHNQQSKRITKYMATNTASAIIKYTGCILDNLLYYQQASSMAHQNYRNKSTCLFKQVKADTMILPVKAHQLYKDIILLKQPIADILILFDSHTNLSFP